MYIRILRYRVINIDKVNWQKESGAAFYAAPQIFLWNGILL